MLQNPTVAGGLPSPKASDAQNHGVGCRGVPHGPVRFFLATTFFARKAKWTACMMFFLSCDFCGHVSTIRPCATAKCFLSFRAVAGSLNACIETFTNHVRRETIVRRPLSEFRASDEYYSKPLGNSPCGRGSVRWLGHNLSMAPFVTRCTCLNESQTIAKLTNKLLELDRGAVFIVGMFLCISYVDTSLKPYLALIYKRMMRYLIYGNRIIPVQYSQYRGCWCPGSLRHQDISTHDIDYKQCM